MVSHLFLATDIGMMATSVAAAVFLGAIVLQAETKTAPPTTTVVIMMNETRCGPPSTPLSNPCLREGKG